MRTTIDIDAALLRRLRSEALKRGLSFKDAVAGALRRGLDEGAAPSRRRYSTPSYAMGSLVQPLDLDKALAIAAGLEDEEVGRKLAMRK